VVFNYKNTGCGYLLLEKMLYVEATFVRIQDTGVYTKHHRPGAAPEPSTVWFVSHDTLDRPPEIASRQGFMKGVDPCALARSHRWYG
jgi:hypothetical protein